MFKSYHNQIRELRKSIRLSSYHKELYDECVRSFKEQTSIIKKTETKLRYVQSVKSENFPDNLAYLFSDWINSKNLRNDKRKQDLIKAKLTQMAAVKVHGFLQTRVDSLWEEKRLLKGLKTQEKKVIEKLEKTIQASKDPKTSSVVPFIISEENLIIDLEETESIYDLGSNALNILNGAVQKLAVISDIPVSEIEKSNEKGELVFQAFIDAVDAYTYLCPFKNELTHYADNRDLQLHLSSLSDFMKSFINQLVLDWTEQERIRQSLIHLRKTINIVEALLIGLKSKISKINSELSLTSHELSALLNRMELI